MDEVTTSRFVSARNTDAKTLMVDDIATMEPMVDCTMRAMEDDMRAVTAWWREQFWIEKWTGVGKFSNGDGPLRPLWPMEESSKATEAVSNRVNEETTRPPLAKLFENATALRTRLLCPDMAINGAADTILSVYKSFSLPMDPLVKMLNKGTADKLLLR